VVLNVLSSASQWEPEAIGVAPDGARLEPDAQEEVPRAVAGSFAHTAFRFASSLPSCTSAASEAGQSEDLHRCR